MSEIQIVWGGSGWEVHPDDRPWAGDGKCSFSCGRDAHAFWLFSGSEAMRACRWCAVEKLPLLIADAIAGSVRGGRTLEGSEFARALVPLEGAFWRGAAPALGRRLRRVTAEVDACPRCGGSIVTGLHRGVCADCYADDLNAEDDS